jgi:hypothetical protein
VRAGITEGTCFGFLNDEQRFVAFWYCSLGRYHGIETEGRESRLHSAVKHMKRGALKFAVLLSVSIRKLEQGTMWHTRRKPADRGNWENKAECFWDQASGR